ncbi:MAG: hypothetical protein ACYDBL_00900, partial [Candidatus Acidiferrales bacterium]
QIAEYLAAETGSLLSDRAGAFIAGTKTSAATTAKAAFRITFRFCLMVLITLSKSITLYRKQATGLNTFLP